VAHSVDEQLQVLVERARSGDEQSFAGLLEELRSRRPGVAQLLEYARSHEEVLRRAAIVLARSETSAELLAALRGLADDASDAVRYCLAEAVEDTAWWPFEEVIAELLRDEASDVRQRAVRAAARRPALEVVLVNRLAHDDSWRVRQEIARVLARGVPRAVLPVLLTVLAQDDDSDVQRECACSAEYLLTRLGGYPADLGRPSFALIREAHGRVGKLGSGCCPVLAKWLEERITNDVDVEALKSFGTVLTLEAEAGRLPRAYEVDEPIAALLQVLTGKPPRAAVLVGEAGVGKTAILHELTHRLRQGPRRAVVGAHSLARRFPGRHRLPRRVGDARAQPGAGHPPAAPRRAARAQPRRAGHDGQIQQERGQRGHGPGAPH
jgi:ATP-dependent Clp protease ATP-binding subunit ClpA